MLNVKNMLVPIDFSTCAESALVYAVEIARSSNACVHLLHVVDEGLFGPPYIPQGGFVYPIDRVELYRRLDALKAQYPEVPMETAVTIGKPADEIVRYAGENDVGLIVISTHGRHGLARILGSTTESVVRQAPCPVLTLRGHVANKEREQIEAAANAVHAEDERAPKENARRA